MTQIAQVDPAQGLPEAAIKVLAGALVISRLSWGGYISSLIHLVLSGLITSTPKLTHMGLSTGLPYNLAAGFPRASNPRENVRTPNMEAALLYNLISEMIAHHFCHILFIKSKTVTPAHTQGQEITQRREYQEMGSGWAILVAAYHKHLKEKLRNRAHCYSK